MVLKVGFPFVIFVVSKVFHEFCRGIAQMERHLCVWILAGKRLGAAHGVGGLARLGGLGECG